MSSTINAAAHNTASFTPARRAGEAGNAAGAAAPVADNGLGTIVDTVEISEEARQLSLQAGNQELPPVGILDPAKRMELGSEEHKKFTEFMAKVKGQKSSVMSGIQSVLEKNGIRLSGLGKLKLEVDSGGRIVVGGIKDKDMAKRIEKALNNEPGLAASVAEYQKNEKEFSRQVKDYTGATLHELGMAARGQVNSRIEEKGGYEDTRAYERLAFIGSAALFINADDVKAFSFDGNIDFSTEVSAMTDPEGAVTDEMDGMFDKVKESFGKLNGKLLARLQSEAGEGGEIDKAEFERMFLNADKAVITVDSRGEIKVEGELAPDAATNRRGLEIIEKLVKDMLMDVGTNSYGVNLFSLGADGFLAREEERGRGGSRMVARMEFGQVVKLAAEKDATGSGALEQRLQAMRREANHRLLG